MSARVPCGQAPPEAGVPRWHLSWVPRGRRDEACAFIENRYLFRHRAVIRVQYPRLLALSSLDGALQAVVGLRRGDQMPLVVDDYLGMPAGNALVESGLAAECPDPSRIMEVGALAGGSPGAGRRLMLSLVLVLESLGIEWLVVTASRDVRNGLGKLGIDMTELAIAQRSRLRDGADWGTYYRSDPRVVAIRPCREATRLRETPLGARLLARAPRLASRRPAAAGGGRAEVET
ncbi:thermostable hemolysin [Halomonas sp. V046]|uniref:thermostable hemolysin n=1 Tax=Halomonas sp. V046 TaxID=3459611 RepID=UPI0040448873